MLDSGAHCEKNRFLHALKFKNDVKKRQFCRHVILKIHDVAPEDFDLSKVARAGFEFDITDLEFLHRHISSMASLSTYECL